MTVSGGDIIYASDINQRIPLVDQMTSDSSSITSTTLVTVLTLTLPYTGTWAWQADLIIVNATNTGRVGFALGGTSTPTAWRWNSGYAPYNSATGLQGFIDSGTSYPGSTSGTALVNSDLSGTGGFGRAAISGTVTVSAVGTLTFRISRTAGTSTVTVKSGSRVIAFLE